MNDISPLRIFVKAILLFVLFNLIFAAVNPMPAIGQLTLYNGLLPGRERLPYGDDPERSYNLNMYSLEAMFASHEVARQKTENEFRAFVVGDSSAWGFLLEKDQTLTAALNDVEMQSADGREVRFYNLGHPTISLTKDLMILDYAMQYEPDLIIWLVTLEAFPNNKQATSPLVQNNRARVGEMSEIYSLPVDVSNPDLVQLDFFGRTIVGQRRNLADILRLQLYGFMWAATGIDVFIPAEYELRAVDLEANQDYYGLNPPELFPEDLAFSVLDAGMGVAGQIPILIVNEPIFVSNGTNSDIRYNSFYPLWIYDQYRELLINYSNEHQWNYVDLWQAAENDEFTNTPIHLTPNGTQQLAGSLAQFLVTEFNFKP